MAGAAGGTALDVKSPVLEIEAFLVDGVWVFSHAYEDFLLPDSWEESSMADVSTGLVDGCLTIGGDIVVFHEHDIVDAEAAVACEVAGEQHLTLGVWGAVGRLAGLPSDSVRNAIAERCPDLDTWIARGAYENLSGM